MAKLKDNSGKFVAWFSNCVSFKYLFENDGYLNIFVCLEAMPQNIHIVTLISIDIAQKLHSVSLCLMKSIYHFCLWIIFTQTHNNQGSPCELHTFDDFFFTLNSFPQFTYFTFWIHNSWQSSNKFRFSDPKKLPVWMIQHDENFPKSQW